MTKITNPLSLALWKYISDTKRIVNEYHSWSLHQYCGERTLIVYDRWSNHIVAVAVDDGDTFHHPSSDYFVGKY